MPFTFDLKLGQQRVVHANPFDANNNPAVPFGDLQWDNPQPGQLGVVPSGAGNPTALIKSNGAIGSFNVTVKGLPYSGGTQVTQAITINVLPGDLDHFTPTADPPVPIS